MTTPSDPNEPGAGGLPPHLDPRVARKGPPPQVTHAYRQAARGGPAAATVLPPSQPAIRPRTRGRRFGRILSWIAVSTAAIVLIAAGGLYIAFNHYNGQISRFNVFAQLTHRPKAVKSDAVNYLLVGSDSREGANGVGTQGKGADFVVGQRSDTVILVHLFGTSKRAELVSFPRDSYVEIPEFTNPKTGKVTPAHHNKLNSAYSEGGAPLLIATLEKLSNIRIDHFLAIDFTGFKGMVNELGGVDVCLTKPAKDSFSGIDLSAGNHHISGDVALAFVRQRHGLANGDIDRIARQQQFIGSLTHKVLSADTLTNPFKLNGVLDVATKSLKADEGLTGNDLKNLALRLRSINSGGVAFITVPIEQINGRRDGASVVLLDDAKAATLFDSLRNDQAPGTPAKASPGTKAGALVVAPSKVRVAVYNGSGVKGLGRKAAADLGGFGFQIIGIPTNRGAGASATTIYYGATRADSARTLQAAIPGSVLQADSSLGTTLDLVVGSGYTGAHQVTVTGTPATRAPTASTATVPVKTAADNPCTT